MDDYIYVIYTVTWAGNIHTHANYKTGYPGKVGRKVSMTEGDTKGLYYFI